MDMFTIAVNGSYPRLLDPPRPQLLQRAIENFRQGRITERELKRAKDRATVDAVAEMVAAGVELVSDGQVRWENPMIHICRELGGFAVKDDYQESDNGHYKPRAVERIKWTHPILLDDYRFLQDRSPVEVRPVLTGPFSLARLCDPGVYGDDTSSFANDLADALNRELMGLEAGGFKYILVEEPLIASNKDKITAFVETANLLCNSVKAKVMLCTFGGDMVGIEDELNETPFSGFSFDLCDGPENERLLAVDTMWKDRILQLGLVHSRKLEVERPTDIARTLLKVAQFHDPELIWAAPSAGLGFLPRDVAFAKLKSLYTGADRARREIARLERPGGSLPGQR
ncbi:MAG TPA: hypothetical protein ENL08_06340 [Bacteroidetes bacterium]|nr:hypothetical protein [Bacteroidota bacterium]